MYNFGASVWQILEGDITEEPLSLFRKSNKILVKVLRFLLLNPRLKRMFKEIAKHMIWNDKLRVKDGKLCHPAEANTRKTLDNVDLDLQKIVIT